MRWRGPAPTSHAAIATAPGLGRGHGPLNHGHTVRPFADAPVAVTGTSG